MVMRVASRRVVCRGGWAARRGGLAAVLIWLLRGLQGGALLAEGGDEGGEEVGSLGRHRGCGCGACIVEKGIGWMRLEAGSPLSIVAGAGCDAMAPQSPRRGDAVETSAGLSAGRPGKRKSRRAGPGRSNGAGSLPYRTGEMAASSGSCPTSSCPLAVLQRVLAVWTCRVVCAGGKGRGGG